MPEGGKVTSPLYVFGQRGPIPVSVSAPEHEVLEPNTELCLRLDLRPVLDAFKRQGYFTLQSGTKLKKEDFKGVWVAGNTSPLTWEFGDLAKNKNLQLHETHEAGIYEVKLMFNITDELPKHENDQKGESWKLQTDISHFPKYNSPHVLANALYNMSLEEIIKCVRQDGAYMAGAEWEGVWTRDISYSIVLALAFLDPEATKISLMKKVTSDGRIIQDTGTGGSWPCSSDRMTWALAASELYRVTGNKKWLRQAYDIIKKSTVADLVTVHHKESGLFYGESSFLDWREQSYPVWMQPVDIYKSMCLGTNIVHYQTYRILVEMGKALGDDVSEFEAIAAGIKSGLDEHLWQEDKGIYAQFLYGRNYFSVSPRAEALGESLAILFNVADDKKQERILCNNPVTSFGVPSVFPQQPGHPPYHNDGVWPFVQAFWTWAGAKGSNAAVVEHGIGAMYRQGALFLTNKENLVATTGDFMGTVINSDRQLWSVAGNLSMVYRVLFGMQFEEDRLVFKPFVPKAWAGDRTLTDVKFRKAVLNISLRGYGHKVSKVTLDGKEISAPEIAATLEGKHDLVIDLDNKELPEAKMNMTKNHYTLETPQVVQEGGVLKWKPVSKAKKYIILENGKKCGETIDNHFKLQPKKAFIEFSVKAIDDQGWESYKSEPIGAYPDTHQLTNEVKSDAGKELQIKTKVSESGEYLIDFLYANGNGPINTDNKCAIRTLQVDGKTIGKIVLPQRGSVSSKGYTNALVTKIEPGEHTITLVITETDQNMNGEVNEAYIDTIRLLRK